ncbi:MAG TPA: SDR family oxidoreductase [Ramlibacter sp.]|nr:SDR family oxidoreductase [Ramlibacter sp.]
MTYTPKMEAKRWGLDPDQLAMLDTVYRPDLFKDQRFLISGAGSGMGRALAYLVTRLGGKVMICGRDEQRLAAVADDIGQRFGVRVFTRAMTIRDPEQVNALMDDAFDRLGGLDGLVNSAGGQFPQAALDFSVKGWNAVVDTNLNGTWYMMQAAARRWRDRGEPGSIVNIVATIDRGIPHSAHTAAARAGVVYLTKSVAVEWAPLRIRVNCLAPGTIETEGLNNYPPDFQQRLGKGNPMRRMGDTWDIAQGVVWLLAPSGKFVTGELLHVDGGMQLCGTNWPLGVPEYFREA